MGDIKTLREWYPWPETKPLVTPECTGWFCGENRDTLTQLLSPATQVVVELGSWQGLSARYIAAAAPNAAVICIDHWLGSTEHHRDPTWRAQLPLLFDTFLSNLWEYRDRVVPMRTTSINGLRELAELGFAPDLIYIDTAHDEESVYQDVRAALRFPLAHLVGDDATWPTVQLGLKRAIRELNERAPDIAAHAAIMFNGPCWNVAPRIA